MIDWVGLWVNALWVLGLAVLLAALSFARCEARHERQKLLAVLDRRPYWLATSGGLGLFAVSLALTAPAWWEKALWAALAVACGGQAAGAWWKARRRLGQ